MKKITLLLLLITTFISCSKSENEEETAIPQALIGTWQFKGIYTHDVLDENDMPIFTAYENGDLITFNSDKTFSHITQTSQCPIQAQTPTSWDLDRYPNEYGSMDLLRQRGLSFVPIQKSRRSIAVLRTALW